MGRLQYASLFTRYYLLEPGDMTCYHFSIAWAGKGAVGRGIKDHNDPNEKESPLTKPWRVAMAGSEDSVLISIDMGHWKGMYPLSTYDAQHPSRYTAGYWASHVPGANKRDVAAVLLAVSVLVDDPHDLRGAAQAMLGASALLGDG